jgi:dTDP-4-dehydrorhamnose reductase
MKFLLFGGKGHIGQEFCKFVSSDYEIVLSDVRVDNEYDVETELCNTKPDRVVSFIGRTFGPGFNTIDYLEQPGKLVDNIRDNLYSPFVLAELCRKHGIHFTYIGTGCIFDYHGDESSLFTEESKPNFFGSSYSIVKGFTDRMMHFYEDSTLNIRIRMPIFSKANKRDFIEKLVSYQKICSCKNSITVLPDLLPVLLDMIDKKITGTVNLVNPGVIEHNEILSMYRDIVDPSKTWEEINVEEHDAMLLSKRSNNHLDTKKLEAIYPTIPSARDSVEAILKTRKEIS